VGAPALSFWRAGNRAVPCGLRPLGAAAARLASVIEGAGSMDGQACLGCDGVLAICEPSKRVAAYRSGRGAPRA